ncbi:MAG TPA: tripartite tricarboxylate transporter substrate binding protein [Pseudolabrys sp.]
MRVLAVLMACALYFASGAWAQDAAANYPNRPIKIVICVPAGGGVDVVTRIVADSLQRKFGQPVTVENRGGAAGNIGADYAFHADSDGYTLLAAQPAPLTINPLLYKRLNYDPTKFVPLAIMTTIPNVLLVRPDFPAKTLRELIAYAKANPGKINYASQGIGTTSHLTAALLERMAGIKLEHVPYKGTGPALNDIIASHVDMIFMEVASAIKLHQSSNARILAVAADKRIATLPDVPTVDEAAGVKGFVSASWNALAAPPKTPPAIVAKLNAAVNEALKSPEAQAHFAALNLRAVGGSPDDAATFIRSETKVWSGVIEQAGIQPN